MIASRTEAQVNAALTAIEEAGATPAENAEMLMEMAMGLQLKPKEPADIEAALGLYDKALEICPDEHVALCARIKARMGTAFLAMPGGVDPLLRARAVFTEALEVMRGDGTPEEIAETEMNLGLVLQNLASANQARIQDAIAAYQRALRTFDRKKHVEEFAILQNNLATAFLSIPLSDEKAKMREALAVQCFEEALEVVNMIDHPNEYAMLHNNLGNALQYASSSHRVENGFRALDAYDEALKVRDAEAAPGAYANTIANKANCLANLPDDVADPERGNPENLKQAIALYKEAAEIFAAYGEAEKTVAVREAIQELEADLASQQKAAAPVH